jgi:hypothetical protein
MSRITSSLIFLLLLGACSNGSGPSRNVKNPEVKRGIGNLPADKQEVQNDTESADNTTQSNIPSPPEGYPRYGLYAFDGTGEVKSNNHIIAQFHDAATPETKEYFAGPNLVGSNTRSVLEAGKRRICEDWLLGRVDKIVLIGYSRGALIAVAAAAELTRPDIDKKDPARVYCGNSEVDKDLLENVPKQKRKPTFVWIGLLDAVDTINYDLIDSVEGTGAECFHLAKKNEWEAILTTKQIKGCQKAHVQTSKKVGFVSMPLGHVDLATDQESLETLVKQAKKSGLSFRLF